MRDAAAAFLKEISLPFVLHVSYSSAAVPFLQQCPNVTFVWDIYTRSDLISFTRQSS